MILVVAYGLIFIGWGDFANRGSIMQIMVVILMTLIVFLVLVASLAKGRERWIAILALFCC
jgi:hypothetical protein